MASRENGYFGEEVCGWLLDGARNDGSPLQDGEGLVFLPRSLDPAGRSTHSFLLESDFAALTLLRLELSPLLGASPEAEMFILCLSELVANAIEHGNRFDPGRRVKVEVVRTEAYLLGAVEDEGEGFNWQEKVERPLELEGEEERGRGIAITRLCCAQLCYNNRGNRVEFMVKL